MIISDIEIRLRDLAKLEADMERARTTVEAATGAIGRAAGAASAALAKMGIGLDLGEVVRMAEAYANVTATLTGATNSARQYSVAYAEVKRIANGSAQGLEQTATLYGSIAESTRELGLSQKQVTEITETVSLSLQASGASAAQAASAQTNLAGAFSTGAMSAAQFKAANEASPALMQALADGMGKPVGALKSMADQGTLTAQVMSAALPAALDKLKEQAAGVETISGAMTVLKNNMMDFVGMQASSSGAVTLLTSAIGFLSSNITLVVGVIGTLGAAKLGSWMGAAAASAITAATAQATLTTSTLALGVATTEAAVAAAAAKFAEARANVSVAASASAAAAAHVVELRAVVAGAQGTMGLAVSLDRLAVAELRAIALGEVHAVALSSQAVAANATMTASNASATAITAQAVAGGVAARSFGLMQGAMLLLGGPISAVITLLGLAATAWMVFGEKSTEASEKSATAVEEDTTEMISRLDKQIAKLRERNGLYATEPRLKDMGEISNADAAGLARAKAQMEANRAGTGEYAIHSVGVRGVTDIDLTHRYEVALLRVKEAQQEVALGAQRTYDEKYAQWQGMNGTADQKRAYELAALRKEFGKITPQQQAFVDAKYASKGGPEQISEETRAYQNLINAIKDKDAAAKLEAQGYSSMTEAQKLTVQLNAEIKKGNKNLTAEIQDKVRAQIAEVASQDAANAAAQKAKDAAKELATERQSAVKAADAEAKANEALVANFGKSKLQMEELSIKSMQDRLKPKPGVTLDDAEIAHLDAMIKAKQANVIAMKALEGLEKGPDTANAKEVLSLMTELDEVTKSAATSMAASFGRIGTAIGGVATAITGYASAQAKIALELDTATKGAGGDQTKITQANAVAAQQSARLQMKSYGDMAGAAKGFFKENSTGYKVMQGAEKAFRAAETAMAIQSMLQKSGLLTAFTGLFASSKAAEVAATAATVPATVAAEGVKQGALATTAMAGAAAVPFPGNIPAFAIVAGMLAAIGLGMFGGGGSGGGQSAAEVQKTQGSGGVFGDPEAKSDSIKRSLEMLEDNGDSLIPLNRGMLTALRAIESSMKGLTNLVIRSPGVTEGTNMGIQTGSRQNGAAIVDSAKLFGGLGPMGSIMSKITGAIFGKTTTTIVDSGIQFGGRVNDLQAGQGFEQYASVDTKKKKLFSSSVSNSVKTQGLEGDLSTQFGLIFTDVENALTHAATALGIGAGHVTSTLDNMTIDVTKISLKGLKGEELNEALNAVLSKTMDDMSEKVFPEMQAFRQLGEGYTETIVRLASNYAKLDASLASIGMTFGATGISSLAAREHLIAASGGIDKFAEVTSGFADNFLSEAERLAPVQSYVTAELGRLGFASVKTREDFKAAVQGFATDGSLMDKTGAETYSSLIALQEAFAAVVPAIKGVGSAAMGASEVLKQNQSLQDQFEQLTMKPEDYRAKQRQKQKDEEIDPSNHWLFDQVGYAQTASDKNAADKAAADKLAATNKTSEDQIETHKKSLMEPTALRAYETKGMDATTVKLYDEVAANKASSALAATRKSYEDQIAVFVKSGKTVKEVRALEIAGMDALTVSLYDSVAAYKAADALKSVNKGYEDQLETMRKSMMKEDELREYETKDMDASTVILYDKVIAMKKVQAKAEADEKQRLEDIETKRRDDEEAARAAQKLAEDAAAAAKQLKEAWQSVTDSIFDEIKRIRGMAEGTGAASLTGVQAEFATRSAQARAGDQEAAKLLPALSQKLLELAEVNAVTALDLARIRARTLNSLTDTGNALAGQFGLALPSFALGTNYLPTDMVAQLHEGERIVPKADNLRLEQHLSGQQGGANGELVAEMRNLRAEVAGLLRPLNKIDNSTKRGSDILEVVTEGGNAMRSKAVAA